MVYQKQLVVVLAPAKLNLSLDAAGLLPNGYHDLDMVMQTIDLYERITLRRSADLTLSLPGSSQQVQCRLEEIPFAARRYSGFWLPAGTYTALRIELGSAQGHNWFCVLYPALCVGSSEARYADTEENALVFGGYQVRFALLDTARSVWQKITD